MWGASLCVFVRCLRALSLCVFVRLCTWAMAKKTSKSGGAASYGRSGCKDAVWALAAKTRGCDPAVTRKDPYGKAIHYSCYGRSGTGGWQIDHIKPRSRGGSDRLHNLQALTTSINCSIRYSIAKKNRHQR